MAFKPTASAPRQQAPIARSASSISGFIDPDIGIYASTQGDNSPIEIENSNRIEAKLQGIFALTQGAGSGIEIVNSGDINSGRQALLAYSNGAGSPVFLENAGDIVSQDTGMKAGAYSDQSPITLINTGAITSQGDGMYARTIGVGSKVSVLNSGDIAARYGPYTTGDGIYVETELADSPIDIVNQGNIEAEDDGIYARTYGANSSITITNSGVIDPVVGIFALALGDGSQNLIVNSGSVFGEFAGILSISYTGTKIVNTGDISAGSFFAIGVSGASAEILNSGKIIGFVDLTENSDTFINQKHGVFETKLTSYFNSGDDLFRNETGGTVRAATSHAVAEHSSFVGLERFENNGLITMQDKHEGDSFRISNTPGGTDLVFTGSSKSTLAVDAFLGGPGSTSDIFVIEGDARGSTRLDVHNTNPGPGSSNKEGIPVVFVDGAVKKDAFFLKQPIDTGFFAYDLFFKPTGSGIFELKTVTGASAHILPHLVTNVQDVFHSTTDTWFDRTADLRVLLNGGPAPVAYDPDAKYAEGPPSGGITPAVWVRGGAEWIGREVTETTKEFGRTYDYKLDGNLNVADFQTGIDLGKRDLLSEGDILVFGVLGGFVHADLGFDAVNRQFNMSGTQAGAYATYLKGGLFVDTLFKADFLDHEQNLIGFPGGIDATSFGVRTDTGYRFGSFRGGAFIEPLATLGVVWSDLDSFALGGNKVSFDDDPNVRGRLGLRVGTSMGVWAGTTMEPFVIGSVWGDLSGDRSASIVSNGDTFNFEHDPEDVWGEVSAGVNFFSPSASTAVFAKLDVTFGEDLEGFGGKAGMRVNW